jgi:hypothetical protein
MYGQDLIGRGDRDALTSGISINNYRSCLIFSESATVATGSHERLVFCSSRRGPLRGYTVRDVSAATTVNFSTNPVGL